MADRMVAVTSVGQSPSSGSGGIGEHGSLFSVDSGHNSLAWTEMDANHRNDANPWWLSSSAHQQKWDLSFSVRATEAAFWRYLKKRIRWASALLYICFGIFTFVWVTININDEIRVTGNRYGTWLIVALGVVEGIMVIRQNPSNIDCFLKISTGLLFAFLLILALVLNVTTYVVDVQNDCEDTTNVFDRYSRVQKLNACHRSLRSGGVATLMLAVLRQMQVTHVAALALVNFAMALAFLFAVGRRQGDEDIIVYLIVHHIAYSLYFLLVRYQIEANERKWFVEYDTLRCRVEELEARRAALLEAVNLFIPEALVKRSASGSVPVDSVDRGCVVAVGLHDLAVFSTRYQPMEVTRLVDDSVSKAAAALQAAGLDRVSVLLDEVLAVGGLIGKTKVKTSVIQGITIDAADALLRFTRYHKSRFPARAAIDVGPCVGRFVGVGRVRYDVSGSAADGARVSLIHAKAGEVMVTERAAALCDGMVELKGSGQEGGEGSVVKWEPVTGLCFDGKCAVVSRIVRADTKSSSQNFSMGDSAESTNRNSSELDQRPKYSQSIKMAEETLNFAKVVTAPPESVVELPTRRVWGCYERFADDAVEEDFHASRARSLLPRAWAVLLGLAAIHTVLLMMAIADVPQSSPRFTIALVLMILGILVEVVLSFATTKLMALKNETLLTFHQYWSAVALLAPLFVLVGAQLTRPSIVGNESFHMVLTATMARSPCFYSARHQAIFLPLLVVVSLALTVVLPHGDIVSLNIAEVIFIIYTIFVDRDLDAAQRVAYLNSRANVAVLKDLEIERSIRNGLLANAMPQVAVQGLRQMEMGVRCVVGQQNSAIMLFSMPRSGEPKVNQEVLSRLIDATEHYEHLDVIHFSHDCVIIVGPIASGAPADAQVEDVFAEVWALLRRFRHTMSQSVPEHQRLSVLVDQDTTIQVMHNTLMPRYAVYGASLTRLVSVHRLVGREALQGLLVTERCLQLLREIPLFVADEVEEAMSAPLRVRGVGVVRFVQLLGEESRRASSRDTRSSEN